MANKDLAREQNLLADELGREHGHPRFQWRFSENLYMPMQDKDHPYTFEANPTTGIIETRTNYTLRKMCPTLYRQWVMCRWLDPGPLETWVAIFGNKVEYPANGYYAATNVALDPEISPWDTSQEGVSVTRGILDSIRRQEQKTAADYKAEGEAILERQERENDRKLDEMLECTYMPFNHVPGKCDNVSVPSVHTDKGAIS